MTDPKTGTTADRRASTEDAGPAGAHLETPRLCFDDVPAGGSGSKPIIVRLPPEAGVAELEILNPPFAPFSVVRRPTGVVREADGDRRAAVWIRYDATSPMADDRGRVTVGDRLTGSCWTVELLGSGPLARPQAA